MFKLKNIFGKSTPVKQHRESRTDKVAGKNRRLANGASVDEHMALRFGAEHNHNRSTEYAYSVVQTGSSI